MEVAANYVISPEGGPFLLTLPFDKKTFGSPAFLDPELLYKPPFTSLHYEGLDGVFNGGKSDKIVEIVRRESGLGVSG